MYTYCVYWLRRGGYVHTIESVCQNCCESVYSSKSQTAPYKFTLPNVTSGHMPMWLVTLVVGSVIGYKVSRTIYLYDNELVGMHGDDF